MCQEHFGGQRTSLEFSRHIPGLMDPAKGHMEHMANEIVVNDDNPGTNIVGQLKKEDRVKEASKKKMYLVQCGEARTVAHGEPQVV